MNVITITAKVVAPPQPAFVGSLMTTHATDECMEADISAAEFADGFDTLTVDWGDGCITTHQELRWIYHEYAEEGTYVVKIPDVLKKLELSFPAKSEAFGALSMVAFTTNAKNLKELDSGCFAFCGNLTTVDFRDGALEKIGSKTFRDCTSLSGRLDFPHVKEITGSNVNQPFQGCEQIREIHFAAANEAAVKATSAYHYDPHLGAANATLFFDL